MVELFPAIDLPVRPPYPPMEARLVTSLPAGDGWLYEPKWDGFRCLAFRSGAEVLLQSKAGQPLGRYFPELVDALRSLPQPRFVLDGEIVIFVDGALAFDDLLQRIHPAESRVRKLARETPVTFLVFDLLVDAEGRDLIALPLAERRAWSLPASRAALPAGRAAGAETARRSGSRCAPTSCARCASITSRVGASAMARNFCAGVRTSRRARARWSRSGLAQRGYNSFSCPPLPRAPVTAPPSG